MAKAKYDPKNVGPRIAFGPDGEFLFFDKNGDLLDPKPIEKATEEQFVELFNAHNNLAH